jgi:TolB protein
MSSSASRTIVSSRPETAHQRPGELAALLCRLAGASLGAPLPQYRRRSMRTFLAAVARPTRLSPPQAELARLASGTLSTSRWTGFRTEERRPQPIRVLAWFLTVALVAALGAGPAVAGEVWLDVSKSSGKKIVLALPPLAAPEGPEEATLRQVLENDLLTTGYFRLLPLQGPQLLQAGKERGGGAPDAAVWASWGAELLLSAEAVRRNGRLALRATLLDAGAGTRILTHEESDAPAEAVRLAHRLADAVLRALTGSPSLALTRIVATWSTSPGFKRVVVMDYDGRNLRPISPEGVLALHPAWFPDRTRVAYVTYRQGRPEIVSQNVTTGQVRSLAFFPGLNASPAISPDGRQMLLVLSRDGNPEVYRMAVDGSEIKRLTFTPAVETSPVWSPDGTQIALVSDQGGGPQIHLLGAGGGRMRRVSFVGNYATSPDWSPRGDHIVFTALVEGTFQLFLLDPATGNQEQITFDAEHKENPSFAPDGRHVVCSQGRGSSYRLMVIDTVGGEHFPVTREKGSFTSPAWSP